MCVEMVWKCVDICVEVVWKCADKCDADVVACGATWSSVENGVEKICLSVQPESHGGVVP